MTLTLLHWPLQERPRERLLKNGPQQLSDTELLAIILRSGTRGLTVLELAGSLLTHFGSLRGVISASSHELCAIPGIGKARYCELQAAMEPVHPPRTIDVQGSETLHTKPFIVFAIIRFAVVCVPRKVREANLHVQNPRKHVRDKHIR